MRMNSLRKQASVSRPNPNLIKARDRAVIASISCPLADCLPESLSARFDTPSGLHPQVAGLPRWFEASQRIRSRPLPQASSIASHISVTAHHPVTGSRLLPPPRNHRHPRASARPRRVDPNESTYLTTYFSRIADTVHAGPCTRRSGQGNHEAGCR